MQIYGWMSNQDQFLYPTSSQTLEPSNVFYISYEITAHFFVFELQKHRKLASIAFAREHMNLQRTFAPRKHLHALPT